MPRKRINLGLKQKYGQESLLQAVEDVRTRKYTMRKASEIYKVPLSTLCDNVNGKSKSNKIGAKPKLTPQIEELLADYFATLIHTGSFNPTYNHVSRVISDYLHKHQMSHLFKNGCPGRDWFYEFKKRWRHKLDIPGSESSMMLARARSQSESSVSLIQPQQEPSRQSFVTNTASETSDFAMPAAANSTTSLESNGTSSHSSSSSLNSFVNILERFYSLFDYSNRPENVWTLNEVSISLDCSLVGDPSSLLHKKLPKQNQQSFDMRNRFTLVSCTNAAGECLPPFVVYKSKFPKYDKLVDNNRRLPNSIFCSSPTGWLQSQHLLDWFRDSFLARVSSSTSTTTGGPKILLIDAATTDELSMELVELATSNNVHLICIPSLSLNDSSLLSPIEAGVHRHVRSIWRKILEKYVLKTNATHINRNHLPYLLCKLYEKAFCAEYCANGFVKSGLYPLNHERLLSMTSAATPPNTCTRSVKSTIRRSLSQTDETNPSEDRDEETIETEVISAVDEMGAGLDETEDTQQDNLVINGSDEESTESGAELIVVDDTTSASATTTTTTTTALPEHNESLAAQNHTRMNSLCQVVSNASLVEFSTEMLDRIERLNTEARNIQMSIMGFFDARRYMMLTMPALPLAVAAAFAAAASVNSAPPVPGNNFQIYHQPQASQLSSIPIVDGTSSSSLSSGNKRTREMMMTGDGGDAVGVQPPNKRTRVLEGASSHHRFNHRINQQQQRNNGHI